jgi:hypothetical protein
MEKNLPACAEQELVRRNLVSGDVIGLRLDAPAEGQVRCGKRVHLLKPFEKFARDPVHHAAVRARNVGVQPAESGKPAAVPVPPRNP